MTKKQLSTILNITTAAITYQMRYLTATLDYNVGSKANKYRVEFTPAGIEKLKNRNTKVGRAKLPEKVRGKRGRPRKNLLTIDGDEK